MKKWTARILALVGGCLLLLLAGVAAANSAVINQPAQAITTQPEERTTENAWVSVRMDEGLFTLFAAMNAAGYDHENFELAYHPVRQMVRERLAGRSFSGQARLRSMLKFTHPYNFVVWSLHFGQPPQFSRVVPGWSDPGIPAYLFFGFDEVLRDFYQEMDIAAIWQEARPAYEQEADRYQQAAGQAVQVALDYVRMDDAPLKRLVVIPNLLSAHWSGFGPTVGDTAYVVIGPTENQPDVSLLQHEALHSIVGPLVAASINEIDAEHAAELFASMRKQIPDGYDNWETLVEEQVVRAIDCRLAGAKCEQFVLKNDEAEGFLLERSFVNSLEQFEQGNSTLAEFMPEMLREINQVDLPTP